MIFSSFSVQDHVDIFILASGGNMDWPCHLSAKIDIECYPTVNCCPVPLHEGLLTPYWTFFKGVWWMLYILCFWVAICSTSNICYNDFFLGNKSFRYCKGTYIFKYFSRCCGAYGFCSWHFLGLHPADRSLGHSFYASQTLFRNINHFYISVPDFHTVYCTGSQWVVNLLVGLKCWPI